MKHLKLRIAWSLAWGIAMVLLVALWVRSYWTLDRMFGPIGSAQVVTIDVLRGKLNISYIGPPSGIIDGPSCWSYYNDEAELQPPDANGPSSLLGFGWNSQEGERYLMLPFWASAFAFAILSASVWVASWSNRFSLRTLLIATTLVAIGLGMVVWLR